MLRFRLHFIQDMPKLEVLNFASYCSNILKVWWKVLYGFCWKFTWLSSSERILKIRYKLPKLSPWVWCTTFLGHSVYSDRTNDGFLGHHANNVLSAILFCWQNVRRCRVSTSLENLVKSGIFHEKWLDWLGQEKLHIGLNSCLLMFLIVYIFIGLSVV